MATEVDHDQIKTKIAAILTANTTLFTAATLTKIRSIDVGYPQGDPMTDQMFDYIFITNAIPFETIRNRGAVVSNIPKVLEHVFNYDITIIVNGKDSRDAELKLDDFQKLTLETIEVDHNLTGAGSAEVDDSFPIAVRPFRNADLAKAKQGRVITLRCVKTTS